MRPGLTDLIKYQGTLDLCLYARSRNACAESNVRFAKAEGIRVGEVINRPFEVEADLGDQKYPVTCEKSVDAIKRNCNPHLIDVWDL